MAAPVFQMLPAAGPLRLASDATSDPMAFHVGVQASGMFLRLIAVGPDCAPPGEAAPTIELRTELGEFAVVPRSPEEISIHDETLFEVGTASCSRQPRDVFLVKLDIFKSADRPWHVRITNNAPKELSFVWVVSDLEEDTLQPRISMERSHERRAPSGAPMADIRVDIGNVGPGPLNLTNAAGTDMGVGFTLDEVTPTIPPNACGHLVIKVAPITHPPFGGPARLSTDFVLKCNARDEEEKTLHLTRSEKIEKESKDGKETKDKDGKEGKDKEHKDTPHELMMVPGPFPRPVGPVPAWASTDSSHVHFIPPELRPDLSTSALAHEDQEP
ncbi:hypothetical protein ACFYXM_12110 [Streptomyces sp. NPDC002476]|uniref:hypothetical protein n=1 Tax=Streptomyces sp. NPDC002476 TaxID=3364648 RepID=UPI0036B0741E